MKLRILCHLCECRISKERGHVVLHISKERGLQKKRMFMIENILNVLLLKGTVRRVVR